jgi:hypothetical protein
MYFNMHFYLRTMYFYYFVYLLFVQVRDCVGYEGVGVFIYNIVTSVVRTCIVHTHSTVHLCFFKVQKSVICYPVFTNSTGRASRYYLKLCVQYGCEEADRRINVNVSLRHLHYVTTNIALELRYMLVYAFERIPLALEHEVRFPACIALELTVLIDF